MDDMKKRFAKVTEFKVGIVMMAAVFIVFFADFNFLNTVSQKMMDMNFLMRGPIEGKRDVVVVAIDQRSQEKLGRWPWTRSVMADLIRAVSKYRPRAIGLDIVFSYPEDRPDRLLAAEVSKLTPRNTPAYAKLKEAETKADTDGLLAASIGDAGNVVTGYFFFTRHEEVESLELDNESDFRLIKPFRYPVVKIPKSGKKEFDLTKAVGVKPNITQISEASRFSGFFNMLTDDDGMMRKYTNVVEMNGKFFPSLGFQLLRTWYEDAKPRLEFEDYGVKAFYVGDRTVASNDYGQSILNFYGTETAFPTVSVSDILDGTLSDDQMKELLGDKIIIVGATATGIYDLRSTPFGIMPGVYLHATFVQNVIDNRVLNKAGWLFAFDAVSILFLGLLLTFSMRRLNVVGGGLLAVALVLAYIYFQRYVFVRQNTVLDVFYPLLAIVMVYGGLAFFKYFAESREKKYVKKAFEHYLSPEVINRIMEDPGKLALGGETKVLSVCFSDVKDFSTISEKLSPHELVELLNEYLTEMTRIMMKNDGTLDKYIGDAIVSFFGAPLSYDDHAVRACRAVLQCQKRLDELRPKWAAEKKPLIEARFGINTGPMLVGNMGSHQRFDYTVMGDEVNLASRLEGTNKQYGTFLLISESTWLATNGEFEGRELDIIRVVGRTTPVRIYELIDFKGGLTSAQREWLEAYNNAYGLYRKRDFENAVGAFEELVRMNKSDTASWRFVGRCRTFVNNPPDDDWDGVYSQTSK